MAGIEDPEISWKAKGIWSLLLSRTPDWKTRPAWLVSMSTDGKSAVGSGLRELVEGGYLLTRQGQAEDGRFMGYEYLVLGARIDMLLEPAEKRLEAWKRGESEEELQGGGILQLDRGSNRAVAQIDVGGLIDPALSFRAKGIWVYLMSRPDSWETKMKSLIKVSTEGADAVYSAVNQLLEAGYLKRRQVRRADGTWAPVEYYYFEKPFDVLQREVAALATWDAVESAPQTENPDAVKSAPQTENPDAVKSAPQTENPDAVETPASMRVIAQNTAPQTENPDAVDSPDRENQQAVYQQAVYQQAENPPLLSVSSTQRDLTYVLGHVRSVAKSQELVLDDAADVAAKELKRKDRPTHRPTLSVDEALSQAGETDLNGFVEKLAELYSLDWSTHHCSILIEEFAPLDCRLARIWLAEKLHRLKQRGYSGIGILDMAVKDIRAGECPEPRPSFIQADEEPPPSVEDEVRAEVDPVEVVLHPPGGAWSEALEVLQTQVNQHNFDMWFMKLRALGYDQDGLWLFEVDDPFVAVWVADNYLDLVEKALDSAGAPMGGVRIEVEGSFIVRRPESA